MPDFFEIFGLGGIEGDDFDPIPIDLDGDGVPDAMGIDTDGDGFIDAVQSYFEFDSDGDGYTDALSIQTDYNLDGIPDMEQVLRDSDLDGTFDQLTEIFTVDENADGVVDSFLIMDDSDLDGAFDAVYITDAGDMTDFADQINSYQDDMDDVSYDAPTPVQNFDPNNYDPDDIVGDPAGAIEAYHTQEADYSCAVAAQEFAIQQLTGRDFTEAELRDLADENDWYDPNGGTPMYDVGNILEHHGLTVSRDFGNDMDDIESCLEAGGAVIVGVDCFELYTDDNFGPGMDANHAIQVIGIDKSDPDNPMVIVNDSGIADGAGAMIPLDNFMEAWADSDFFMVDAYA